jgi:hypothetical protein
VSLIVQALPSLHELLLFVCVQPLAGLQLSSVHPLPSSQWGATPPTQAPPAQVSLVVQALPSLHGLELLTWRQPSAESQESSVQRLPSLHTGGPPPTHAPLEHVSLVVQALWSSQGSLLLVKMQPLAGLQVSVVQPLPSLHAVGPPPTQAPPEQVSLVVQALPSLQGPLLFTCTQPVAEAHESSVHALPSLQSGGAPPTQTPPAQVSFVVQALPSLQRSVLLVNTQTPLGQVSVVQPLVSSHWLSWVHSVQPEVGVPPHTPPEQTSPLVQA